MNSIVLSFNAVFPLLGFMLTGYALRRLGLLDENTASGLSKLVFKVFLPLNIVQSIYNADIRTAFDVKLALFVAVSCICSFLIISASVKARIKEPTIAPVMIQGMHKANYNLLAIPIVSSFFGSELGMTAVLVAVVTPIVNTCSTIAFESARGGSIGLSKMLKKIVTNPLVLSSIIGLALNLSGLKVPAVVMNSVVGKLAAMATPCAMLGLGAGFNFAEMKNWVRHLSAVVLVKLIILPSVIVPLAVLLGIRGANLIAVLIYSGSPSAVNSYSTAVSMGGNEKLAGEIVAVTSLLSVLTLFIFLSTLGTLGYL
jgi:predicted permease